MVTIAQPTLAKDNPIKIGTRGGPGAQIFEFVKQEAAKQGLNVQVVIFNDLLQPLEGLAAGDLDANFASYQTRIDKFNAERRYKHKVVTISKIALFALGLYSKKIKSLNDLPQGAMVGIANEPVNGGRALLLLQEHGLIKLDPAAGAEASPLDIIENPKQIHFIELDAAQMPRSLDDTHASVINANYAIQIGLNPIEDALALESKSGDSPYAGTFVVREGDQHRPEWQKLLAIYHSQIVKDFILSTFKGSIIP